MTDKHKDVDSYLDSLSAHKRPHLNKLRAMIRKAVPKATESIKYNLPYYEANGMLCAFAAQKNYFSFYGPSTSSRESEWPLRVPQGTQARSMVVKRVELHVKC
ncbi:MAG: DUF1801 domain-containing protein [Acidobacteriota bacterium]